MRSCQHLRQKWSVVNEQLLFVGWQGLDYEGSKGRETEKALAREVTERCGLSEEDNVPGQWLLGPLGEGLWVWPHEASRAKVGPGCTSWRLMGHECWP